MTQQLASLSAVDGITPTFHRFVAGVRAYLRDYPELNRLLDDQESSDRAIVHGVMQMLSDFASSPPLLGWYSLETLVDDNYMYQPCLAGTCHFVLMSVLAHYRRNEIPFSDGGLSVNTPALIVEMRDQAMLMKGEWEAQKTKIKVSWNIEGMYGVSGQGTEYQAINTWLTQNV